MPAPARLPAPNATTTKKDDSSSEDESSDEESTTDDDGDTPITAAVPQPPPPMSKPATASAAKSAAAKPTPAAAETSTKPKPAPLQRAPSKWKPPDPAISAKYFEGAGEAAGVQVWRVENLAPVVVERSEHGKFYSGDSYIVLKTMPKKSGGFDYDLFFWLGESTSIDEQGAAALLAVQLDDRLGGAPVQHRAVQGHEPAEFVACFAGGTIQYMDGGVDSAFAKVGNDVLPTRLLHVKGFKQTRCVSVEVSATSMNGGDVFILDVGYRVFVWNGKGANHLEKGKAAQVAMGIRDERMHLDHLVDSDGNPVRGGIEVVRMDQGQPDEDNAEFWRLLGGSKRDVQPALDDSAEDDKRAAGQTVLYQLHEDEATGKLTKSKCKGVWREMLDETDTFILVCPNEIFAWIGKKATDAERKNAMVKAQKLIPEMNMPMTTPIVRVVDGAEPQAFKSKFDDWQKINLDKPDFDNLVLGKGIFSGGNVAKGIKEETPEQIVKKVMVATPQELKRRKEAREKEVPRMPAVGSLWRVGESGPLNGRADLPSLGRCWTAEPDGKVWSGRGEAVLKVWVVANFRKVEVVPELMGQFQAGDCYIVLFRYVEDNKEVVVIYHWHGRMCSADERGSAALLVRTMDDDWFGGNARQERVVQNNEPEDFIALFGGKMVVAEGGRSKSGVDTRDKDGIALYQVKGQSALAVRAVQVVESAASLNSGDCFVLQRPGAVDVWQGGGASKEEQRTSLLVGQAIASRLEYTATTKDAAADAAAALKSAQAELVNVDDDGDGIPDMAFPLLLSTPAEGEGSGVPGGGMPGGAHAEKLGTYLPQAGLENERPFYAHESNPGLRLWWAKGRWWLGKRDEQGRNRGWLKVRSEEYTPPAGGWIVYVTKEKEWKEAEALTCVAAERIVLGGEAPGDGVHAEKLGEFCRTTDVINQRPVFCREARPNLMLWWSAGRWWLGKRDELGTHRGWIKAHSEARSPLDVEGGWLVFSSKEKKWLAGERLWCRVNDEHIPRVEKPTGGAASAAAEPTRWAVTPVVEGSEPPAFWAALGGKGAYAESRPPPPSASGFEPRLFFCSDETGAFKVEEVIDFSQEDLEHDDVYILDTYHTVFVWIGSENEGEREQRLAIETAQKYVEAQRALDGRPSSVGVTRVPAGEEPAEFTKEFVGWSKVYAAKYEDPYEKRLRLQREKQKQEEEERADTCEDGKPQQPEDSTPAVAKWGEPNPNEVRDSSVPVKNLIKLTAERNGGKAPPVSALRNGEIIMRNEKIAKAIPIPGGKVAPAIPALALGAMPKIHEASSLDSARRRAHAAQKAAGATAEDGTPYADPETERFTLDEITKGNTGGKSLNPACKELYLADEEFGKIFKKPDGSGMSKDEFWKQPFWKQRDAKKRAGLF